MTRHMWDTQEFTNPNGTFVTNKEGIRAFVPNPLPAKWDPQGALLEAYVRAEKAISGLNAVMSVINVPDFLTALYIRHEAVQSSRIEGTLASLDDLLQYEAGKHMDAEESLRLSITEVANCAKAMEESMRKIVNEGEIDMELIRTAHHILLRKVRGQDKNPGVVRTSQNAISAEGKGIIYFPPPPDRINRLLDELVKFISVQNPQIPILVRCAMAHYQFEAIHPFGDGNGRVGRMLIPLMLARSGVLSHPLLQLGEYLLANRMEYYGCLERVSKKSEWANWYMLFMRAFAEQAEATTRTILELVEIRKKYFRVVSGTSDSIAVRILDMLFGNPYVTTRRVRKSFNVSNTGARRGIIRLEKAGVLRRIHVENKTNFWMAPEIIEAMHSSVKQSEA